MPIKTRCPVGHTLAVPERYAGRTVRCPACGSSFAVPGGETPISPPPVPRDTPPPPAPPSRPKRLPSDKPTRKIDRASAQAAPSSLARPPEPPRPAPVVNDRKVANLVAAPTEVKTSTPAAPLPTIVPRERLSEMTVESLPSIRIDSPRPTDESVRLPFESTTDRFRRRAPDPVDSHRYTTWQLAGFLMVLATLTVAPVIVSVTHAETWGIVFRLPAWCYVLLTLSLVHVAHAMLMAQVPVKATVWAVAQCCLLVAAAYGLCLALAIFSATNNPVLNTMELIDQRLSGNLTRWCLVQVCLWTVMTYAIGRTGLRWRTLS